MAELIFLGRVAEVKFGLVTVIPTEQLRGAGQNELIFEQGHGSDCRMIFHQGKKIFFAGALSFGPSEEYDEELPEALLPIVEKLRRKLALDEVPPDYLE